MINGQQVTTTTTIDVINPANGQVIGTVPDADSDAIQASLKSAAKGFQTWSKTTPAERKSIILCYADLLEENKERIIKLLMAETGNPRANAEYDFGMLPEI